MNNYTLMEMYHILLKHKNGRCENLSISTDEKLIINESKRRKGMMSQMFDVL